jgi:hypothetical protein
MQSYRSCQPGVDDHETSYGYLADLCVLRVGYGLGRLRVQRPTLRDRQQGGWAYMSGRWELALGKVVPGALLDWRFDLPINRGTT